MRTIKKSVYYCDFCTKRTLTKHSISVHEAHCTNNPDRECRICKDGFNIREIVKELKEKFVIKVQHEFDDPQGVETIQWVGDPITLSKIREISRFCPACMLAVIRQTGLNRYKYNLTKEGFDEFDYNKEVEKYWAEEIKEEERMLVYSTY